MSLTITEVLAELDRAGLPKDHMPGENGVSTLCVCCPGQMSWTEGWQRFICDRPDCPSHDYPSAIANALHFRSNRPSSNGNGHHAVEPNRNVVVVPDPRGTTTTTNALDRYAGRVHAPDAMTDLVRQPEEPTPWRVHGLVADGTETVLAAEAGMGKSILLQNLCDGVTDGRATAGFLCAKGVALYVDGEMGAKMFAGRLRKTGASSCAFWYVDALGLDISIEKPDDLSWIRGHIERVGANLVVIDSLRRLMPSKSENDSDDMAPAVAAVAKLARDTGTAIVLVHHKGDGEKFYRGSSAIKDQTDALFGMLPVNPEDDDDMRRRITCRGVRGKAPRYDEAPPDRYVTVNFAEGGVVAADAPGVPGPVVPAREAVAVAIKAAMPAKFKAEVADKIGRRRDDVTFRGAWEDLERAGEIAKSNGGWICGGGGLPLGTTTTTTNGEVIPLRPHDDDPGVSSYLETLGAGGKTTTTDSDDPGVS